MRKRLGWILLGALGFALWLVHTQPVERYILGQIKAELARIGWALNAKRFDINLFQISATAKDISLSGPGVNIQLELAEVNASAGIMTGNLSFDEILVARGVVAIVPNTKPSPQPSTKMTLPEIHLGSATIEQTTLRVNETTQDLDLKVKDINLDYQASILKAGLTTTATTFAGRKLPDIRWQLGLHTESFQEFEDISLIMTAPESSLELKGSVTTSLEPNLTLNATLGSDLLPEQPGLGVLATLNSTEAWVKLNSELAVIDQRIPWQVETQFAYLAQPLRVPVQLQMQGLAEGSIVAMLEETPFGESTSFRQSRQVSIASFPSFS